MAVITRFEDLVAWQEARKLAQMVHGLLRQGHITRDFGISDQLRRSSTSVMTNIAEGFDCESRLEFARFPVIARRSAVEVQSLLYTALDDGYITQDIFDQNYQKASRVKAIINGLKRSLNTTKQVSESQATYDTSDPLDTSDTSDTLDTLDTSSQS